MKQKKEVDHKSIIQYEPTETSEPQYDNLNDYCISILKTSDSSKKAHLALELAYFWRKGKIPQLCKVVLPKEGKLDKQEGSSYLDKEKQFITKVPLYPSRPEGLKIVSPTQVPKRGIGNRKNQIGSIHALAHMESYAIDLSCDILCRYVHVKFERKEEDDRLECDALNEESFVVCDGKGIEIPKEFFDDWVKVLDDEARHFLLLNKRLGDFGSFYGELPAHEGLWQSAVETKDDLLARLCVLHLVHEAIGLDKTPKNIARFKSVKDHETGDLLTYIYEEEITHVESGMKWFLYFSKERIAKGLVDWSKVEKEIQDIDMNQIEQDEDIQSIKLFYSLVAVHFKAKLRGPFNEYGRGKAGMEKKWYEPIAQKTKNQK